MGLAHLFLEVSHSRCHSKPRIRLNRIRIFPVSQCCRATSSFVVSCTGLDIPFTRNFARRLQVFLTRHVFAQQSHSNTCRAVPCRAVHIHEYQSTMWRSRGSPATTNRHRSRLCGPSARSLSRVCRAWTANGRQRPQPQEQLADRERTPRRVARRSSAHRLLIHRDLPYLKATTEGDYLDRKEIQARVHHVLTGLDY